MVNLITLSSSMERTANSSMGSLEVKKVENSLVISECLPEGLNSIG